MKTILTAIVMLIAISLVGSFAFAQMLPPKHPGYPMDKAVSPVTGQPLANDAGQTNATGEKATLEGAASDDAHVSQNLTDENNERLLKKEGAGILPRVQGPQIRIEPPVKEATRMN